MILYGERGERQAWYSFQSPAATTPSFTPMKTRCTAYWLCLVLVKNERSLRRALLRQRATQREDQRAQAPASRPVKVAGTADGQTVGWAMQPLRRNVAFLVLVLLAAGVLGSSTSRDKVLLSEVKVLTLRSGRMTTGRRSCA